MPPLKPDISESIAFAPATCANVAVGFDILGFAIEGIGDQVTLTLRDDENILIDTIAGIDKDKLSVDPSENPVTAVIAKCCHDLNIEQGFNVRIDKGIPVGSGMGSSAALSVAAITALNHFLEKPLDQYTMAQYAIFGEAVVSNTTHADSVVPSLYGGFTLTWKSQPLQVLPLPIPPVHVVLVHPNIQIETSDPRAALPSEFALPDVVSQTGHLALFISAVHQQDMNLLSESLEDALIEPHRAKLIPGFSQVKQAAMEAGCIGASLSGAGPTIFALTDDEVVAERAKVMMTHAFEDQKIHCDTWITRICNTGARIIDPTASLL